MTQSEALSILKTGANVFLTGEPGAGKTYVVDAYASYLRERGIEPAITASTGIAATHLGGMTIHSWSGLGIKKKLDRYDLDRLASSEFIVKRVGRAKVLIIDEVSMLSAESISMLDAVCREVRRRPEPFGGLQIVFGVDFFQLPPVVRRGDDSEESILPERTIVRFAYDAPAWLEANPVVCYISEQHRQTDDGFLSILSSIRRDEFNEVHLSQIGSRIVEAHDAPEYAPKLFSHNADVDKINSEMLDKISAQEKIFGMSSSGNDRIIESLKKGCLSPERLVLKIGAKIMFTKNNVKEGFVNGTLGEVTGFETSGYPVVKTRSGRKILVREAEWSVEENGKIRATIAQLPLRLAWAMTVHKSQGMSLEEAVMDLSSVFEYGQGYVALSRVRTLAGLYLLGWNERTFRVHPEILEKDESFRQASEEARESFEKISDEDLRKIHENFIKASGGKNITIGEKVKSRLDKIREAYPNAYRPWPKDSDEKLTELFSGKTPLKELAKIFGRQAGAIRSRLVKLNLLEE